MKTYLECVPCIIRQALAAARFASSDPAVHENLLYFTLKMLNKMDRALLLARSFIDVCVSC